MGRPTKLTPDVQDRICQGIALGAEYALAAAYGGVAASTMREWMAKGRAGKEPYASFLAAAKQAEGVAAVKWLAKIEQAASDGVWQAAAWKLERRYPHIYGRRVVDQRVSVDDLRRRALDAGLDPDLVIADAEHLSGLLPDSDS